jgi:Skp family chaperone for outer membrane proteins
MTAQKTVSVFALGFMLSAGVAAAQTPPAQPPATQPPATQKPADPAQKPAEAKPRPPVPFPEGARVAFVNFDYVAQTSDEGKAMIARLQEMQKKKTGELADRQKKLDEARKKAADQSSLMNEQARAQAERDIVRLQRDLEDAQQDATNEFNDFSQKIQNEFGQKIRPLLEAIAKEKGIHLVLRAVPEVIAYAHEGIDISEELVQRLNSGAKAPVKK